MLYTYLGITLYTYLGIRWQRLVVRSVVHMRSEWTKKVRVRGKMKVAGTQQIDRCWNHLKKKLSQSNEEPHWPDRKW